MNTGRKPLLYLALSVGTDIFLQSFAKLGLRHPEILNPLSLVVVSINMNSVSGQFIISVVVKFESFKYTYEYPLEPYSVFSSEKSVVRLLTWLIVTVVHKFSTVKGIALDINYLFPYATTVNVTIVVPNIEVSIVKDLQFTVISGIMHNG